MYKYLKQGKQHKKRNLACQDAVCGAEKDGIVVITAADASSENDYGKQGAEIAAETLLFLLLHFFNEIYHMRKEDIQYNMIIQVRKKQQEFCRAHGINLDDVKSTMMAFAYERETKRAILLHLGDGYIVTKANGQYRIVSYPKNAGNPYRTYLTSTIPVSDKIKVYCGEMENLQEFFLLTDGWREFVQTDEEIPLMLQNIEKLIVREGEDDLGLICMNLNDEKSN